MHPLANYVTTIADFPRPGVQFRDIAPLLRHHFSATLEAMGQLYSPQVWQSLDVIAGVESRGFIFAAALAAKYGKGLVMIRKRGKLAGQTLRESYQLEYGEAELEMHPQQQANTLLVDDVLATGGTLKAAAELCTRSGLTVAGLAVLIDLRYLNQFVWRGIKPQSVIVYE